MPKGKVKKSTSPSKLPVPIWRRKPGQRLSRKAVEQSGSVDQGGTDHSAQISLPSSPLPSSNLTSPSVQSPQFGRLDTSDDNNPTPSEDTVRVQVIRENPWLIFSPRPQRLDKSQSAPSSPSRAVLASDLLTARAATAPSSPVALVRGESIPLQWDSSELFETPPSTSNHPSPEEPVQKIPVVSTPESALTPLNPT